MSQRTRPSPSILALALLALGCDDARQEAKQADAAQEASLQAHATIAAEELELAAVVALVEREDVRDAEALEALINAEDSTIRVDIDDDGERDFVQVHELAAEGDDRAKLDADAEFEAKLDADADGAVTVDAADGETARFELRVVPSSKLTAETKTGVEVEAEVEPVVVATVDVELHEAERELVVEAAYAPTVVVESEVVIERRYVHRVELEHRHDHLVVVGAPFLAWVWLDLRPVYHGHVHLPPGHAKKLGLHWHHGGPNEVHIKSKGGHGHGHGHGGPNKVHIKSKGGHGHHGGSSKVHIKSKGGHGHHGGSSKVQIKSKGGGKHKAKFKAKAKGKGKR